MRKLIFIHLSILTLHSIPLALSSRLLLAMRKLTMDELNRKSASEFRESSKLPVVAVLENVRSAYNVGSVFRTADAFLLEAVYLQGYTAFPPHKEIKKTALGAEETVTWKHFKVMEELVAELRAGGYSIFAIEQTDGSIPLHAFHAPEKIALVFGNEVTGVEQSTIALCDGTVEIPQLGMKHSLNISVAAGIALWEVVKSRI